MKRVIERCPNCGVEHDDPKGGACEVCGTTLRFWCRVHSKDIGWLDSATCPRCAAEAARPTPPPRAPAAPPPPRPAPPPPRPAPAPPARPTPAPPLPPRPRRPEPEPPPAHAEDEGIVWIEVPPTRPPRRTRAPPPWGGRDPGAVLREGAEDLAPYAEVGATMAVRMVSAVFALVKSVILWGLLGALAGFFFPQFAGEIGANQDPIWTAMAGAMVGGGLGLFIGTIRATRILFAQRRPPGG
ncbi:hypothetical protein [Longimicrobium sp.]|uniref:hypothetical protein n=1 Tax=Longimicrobium sp. TaxID=2029185 RepID=UPI003B3A3DFF